MGGKNRAIQTIPEDEARKKEEEVPQESELTTPEITILRHNHFSEKVERARALRDAKIEENNKLLRIGVSLNKEVNKLFYMLESLYTEMRKFEPYRKINIIEERLKIKEEEKQLGIANKEIFEVKRIIKEKFIALKEELNKFYEETKKIDDIPLYEDRLIALEKSTKQEIELIEKSILLGKEENSNFEKQIEIDKKINENMLKKLKLTQKEVKLYKQQEDEIYISARNARKEDDEIYIPARYAIRKMKEPTDRERGAKVIEAINDILYINYYISSKSTGTKEMMEILRNMWTPKSKNDIEPELVFHKLVECAEKRLGFFQSWYSQCSFFGQGRKDWVHEFYLTLRYIKNNARKFSPEEIVSMFHKIYDKNLNQSIKDGHTFRIPSREIKNV